MDRTRSDFLGDRHPRAASFIWGLAMGLIFGGGIGLLMSAGWILTLATVSLITFLGAAAMYRYVTAARHDLAIAERPAWTKIPMLVQAIAYGVVLATDNDTAQIAALFVSVAAGVVLTINAFSRVDSTRKNV